MSALAVAVQMAACFGAGAALLRALGLDADGDPGRRLTWSFALGFGILGWSLFWLGILGWFAPAAFWVLLAAGACGCWFLRDVRPPGGRTVRDGWTLVLVLVLCVALGFDLIEALAPPADADSMAYHFALPKEFLAAGRVQFVPRAIDGAIPLLVQMTYVPALALGGERALTLWTMLSAWMVVALAYATARQFLDVRWSLVVALLLASTPAVVYGGGSGQAEIRIALFATVAGLALSQAVTTRDPRFTVVAGVAIGFFMGAKYTGLLFALACGLALTGTLIAVRGRWFLHGALVTAVAIGVGSQWYAWNWFHSGDPVFPVLYGLVDYVDPTFWDAAHQDYLRQNTANGERAVPIGLLWLLAYPFLATFGGPPIFESGRTGLGPFVMLVLPMALLAVAVRFRQIAGHPLFLAAVISILFYVIWFVSGFSQRIRHLLPIYPVALVCLTLAAQRWSRDVRLGMPIALAAVAACTLQLGGYLIFSRNFAVYAFTGETRDQFLRRNIWGYDAVLWINRNLDRSARLYVPIRNVIYHIDVPTYYAHPVQDARIDIRLNAADPPRFLRQLRNQGITHLMVYDGNEPPAPTGMEQWRPLVAASCLTRVQQVPVSVLESRTLPRLLRREETWGIYRLNPTCTIREP